MNIPIGDSFQVCISKPCEAHENKHIPIGPLTFMVQLYMNHFLQFVFGKEGTFFIFRYTFEGYKRMDSNPTSFLCDI